MELNFSGTIQLPQMPQQTAKETGINWRILLFLLIGGATLALIAYGARKRLATARR